MRAVKPPPLRQVHPYAPDDVSDALGQGHCAHPGCGLPRGNARHVLPPVADEVAAVEARRVGGGR